MFNPVTRSMQALSFLPLRVLRWLGWLSGYVFYRVSARRRNVVLTNLRLCFKELNEHQLRALAKAHFVLLGQSLWDRAWLWHAPEQVLNQRIHFSGDFDVFKDSGPLIVLAPHFVGLDAGGVAMTWLKQIPMACVYVPLRNKYVEEWMMQGRNRSGRVRSVARIEGATPLLQILRDGMRLHYSPDMDFGMQGAMWSDFFGVAAATTNSLPRLVKLSRARICTLVTRLTPDGYSIEIGPLWPDYPQGDLQADTDAMNKHIEARVLESPAQYYWVHKRFKTRPPGQPELYRWQ